MVEQQIDASKDIYACHKFVEVNIWTRERFACRMINKSWKRHTYMLAFGERETCEVKIETSDFVNSD